jgi:hypothetical protein
MDDFISAYKQIKVRYEEDAIYKKLLDDGYQLLIQFIKERSTELNTKLAQAQLKSLPYPDEYSVNDKDVAVPSGAMFEFDYSNITRIPDDMLEKMNISIQTTAASGASGSTISGDDLKVLKK